MAKVQVGLRLDPALAVAVDAARGLVPRNRFLEELIARALGSGGPVARGPVSESPRAAELPGPGPPEGLRSIDSVAVEKPYHCSYGRSCSFGTTSPKAICPIHGRKVVAV